tara:strand:+ start:349 stop:516 length:168 start_codon:yes stop_codon:yes gene_type:complete
MIEKYLLRHIQKVLIKSIKKLFQNKWEYFELGSSQADLIEAHIISTIKKTIRGIR